jgi:predicted transcriptional regulator
MLAMVIRYDYMCVMNSVSFNRRFTFNLTAELLEALEHFAAKHQMSNSEYMRRALMEKLEREK